MHWPRIHGLCSVSWCLAEGQWNGDQRRPMGRKAREGLYSLLSLQPICSLLSCYQYESYVCMSTLVSLRKLYIIASYQQIAPTYIKFQFCSWIININSRIMWNSSFWNRKPLSNYSVIPAFLWSSCNFGFQTLVWPVPLKEIITGNLSSWNCNPSQTTPLSVNPAFLRPYCNFGIRTLVWRALFFWHSDWGRSLILVHFQSQNFSGRSLAVTVEVL